MRSPSNSSSQTVVRQPMNRQRPRPPSAVLAETERQWIYSEEELLQTPSILDGMPPEDEKMLRNKGINFIMQVGVMLKLPQLTLSTAGVFFNRFLMRKSLVAKDGARVLHHYQVAATAIFLATKVEETCRKMREIVVAVCRVAQKNPRLLVDEQTKDFWRWRDTILYNEDVLLETICFDLTIEPPHKILFELLKYHNVEHNKRLRNAAWTFINDSNMTQLCLLFTSRTIAAAALYCGAKLCEVAFPDDDGKPWWEIQHVSIREIRRACNYMAGIYEHTVPRDGSESIYVRLRTPEDGDEATAKTRLRQEQTPQSPLGDYGMERSSSEQSAKRPRDDRLAKTESANGSVKDEEPLAGNEKPTQVLKDDDDREAKRPKLETNGSSQEDVHTASQNGDVKPEDVSEEGEVEE